MVREILHAVSRAVEQLVAQRFGVAVEDVVDVERFGLAEAVVGRPGIGLGCLFAGRFQPFERIRIDKTKWVKESDIIAAGA